MIVGLGLLLTTGGYNGRETDLSASGNSGNVSSGTRNNTVPYAEEVVDVQLHTQAHLQVSPTAEAKDLGAPTDSTKDVALGVQELPIPTVAEEVTSLICAYPWPQGCDYWIEVARCESTLGQDPNAYADWNPYVGLFQIWVGHNYGREWLKGDANNVLAAWELSHEGTRTSPWPWCQWQ